MKNKTYIVYALLDEYDKRFYIGITASGLSNRIQGHKYEARMEIDTNLEKNIIINRLLNKGKDLNYEIILCTKSKDIGNTVKKYYINNTDNVVNCFTNENWKMCEEYRKNNSIAQTGKVLTEKTKRKIGDAHLGMVRSPEMRAKISASNRARKGEKRKVKVK